MEKIEEEKFEAKIQEALKSNDSMQQSMAEAVSAWQFLEITEEDYMSSLVPIEIKEEKETKVDGGDSSFEDISKLVLQVET